MSEEDDGLDAGKEAFKEEAAELLTELETSLLELEEHPTDEDLIGRVFRAMHTVKGSGAMFGFDDIAEFTHEVETAFDMVRNGKLAVTKELTNLTLRARDQIRTMIEASEGKATVDHKISKSIIDSLQLLTKGTAAGSPSGHEPAAQKPSKSASGDASHSVTYRIRFKPFADLFVTGTNPILLINELRQMGSCMVVAQIDAITRLEEFNPESCATYWDIILTTTLSTNAIKDVFIFVDDMCDLHVEIVDEEGEYDEAEGYMKLGEILAARGDVKIDELKKLLGKQKKVGEILVDAGIVDSGHIASALAEQQHIKEVREQRQKTTDTAASIRVPSDKLDKLVDLVGELVTVQARLSQTAIIHGEATLTSISEEVERLTWELRDSTMSIRMLPIGSTFSKFKRLVRDLSIELGKEIQMTTDGAETELDKTVIEKLNDPLVHIIRNSIDHGIERPDIREAAGKSKMGTVHLSAGHSGANVLIKIEDDGAGLDKERILKKAIDNGLIAPDAELSEKEIFGMIFAPGFSTAQKITNVSGRGVGMDVVKKNIDALRGLVEVKSRKGSGTTITLRLPLTLAIIDGLLVKIANEVFVIPLAVVEECVELSKKDIERTHGRHVSNVRGILIPYIRLREHFVIEAEEPEMEQIVITEVDDKKVGFVVDYVIGEHQTVIKSLGRVFKDIAGISGATILGDGTVALILDVPTLVRSVETHEPVTADAAG
ncbi:chemotaxis protein CheA [Candidatus Magnetominusculus xianensis]|uniref:Chemotaxis protein CheA n=1 Tax=Candidatus Magnetominusculus xianensis TaxID=1748249 RepID=A0ABR5SF10_9BACT|nr:chemotaxis protein CheA [Candidatus Magnetominusculus xianensis]KWT85372.1 chemotaxis protein CheA [Candidatus Magnetominusculus xianensis]MBF0405149.1 chemotaxis protein CheA [Nitrospirota bacterium]